MLGRGRMFVPAAADRPARAGAICSRQKVDGLVFRPVDRHDHVPAWTVKARHPPDLRISLFCGEALSASLAAAWQAAAPNSLVENLYGPTEATIAISHYRWQPGDETRDFVNGVVPIGTIFPNQRSCLIDSEGRLIAADSTGELCLAGPQLTEGYWNNPEQNAKAFLTIAGSGAERWYRTGDLARSEPDGTLLYLGRTDNQSR